MNVSDTLESLRAKALSDPALRNALLATREHPDALKRTNQWEYFVKDAKFCIDRYGRQNDRSWNIPAQILIQQMHTDTGNGVPES